MKTTIKTLLVILPALLVYAYFADELNFTQDDAYISYRYVANFLNGDGLVYNIGERVEGFTNFGWVLYLILWGAIGFNFIIVSKITGFAFGAGVVIITWLIAREVFGRGDQPFAWLAVFLVAANQSLAYWSPAGLETAAFAFFASLSVYFYLRRSRLLIFGLAAATLMRPEGALVAGILVLIEVVTEHKRPSFSLTCSLIAAALLLPMVAFKLWYYGSLLPNPFYAKTALTLDKIVDGFAYSGQFLAHYGFYGVPLLIPVLFYRKLSRSERAIWFFTILFMLYVVVVGGDVLKVHRFFLPVMGAMAVLTALSVRLLAHRFATKTRHLIVFLVGVPLLIGTYVLPRQYVLSYNALEKSFTAKMSFMAGNLKQTDSSNFSVALPTIGIFGYELMGHRIIDLVGLTDSTVARHPQDPIAGITSTWKEQKYNAGYVLGEAPDYILFSTDHKPSAPAEMALCLYSQFLDSYRCVGFSEPFAAGPQVMIRFIYKRFGEINGELVPVYPVEFVEYYKTGLECHAAGKPREAIQCYNRAAEVGPQPTYVGLLYDLAFSHLLINDVDQAITLMDSVVATDSVMFLANVVLYKFAMVAGDEDKAASHLRWIKKTVPWLVPRLEAETADLLRQSGR